MENTMILHTDKELLEIAIKETADNLEIKEYFIEKDYWISLVLKRLSESKYVDSVVFKGGTSLSKGHKLISRFSEDVDIAVILDPDSSGNKVKTLIRTIEKEISVGLNEIFVKGVTSKGSRFRKSIFEYPVKSDNKITIANSIIIEINSFANPFPYSKIPIQSMIGEFLQDNKQTEMIAKYGLSPFEINVLNKEQTLIEKIVSLVRFSFASNPIESISGKIRHFYDLYYLIDNPDTNNYLYSEEFKNQFNDVISHDRQQFNEPEGWNEKTLLESPIINDFDEIWNSLKSAYISELSMLAYSDIPNEKEIEKSFNEIIDILKTIDV